MFDIRLILNELIINSVVHGNEFNRNKCVNLCLEVVGNTIRIEVADRRKGIDFDISSYDPERTEMLW